MPEVGCPFCGGSGYVRADVDPGHPDFGRALLCSCLEERFAQQRRQILREQSLIGPLQAKTFASLRPNGRHSNNPERYSAVVQAAKSYAENPAGWLIISGIAGCGKTHLAAAIANATVDRGEPALFLFVADLLDHLRSTFGPSSEVRFDELFEQVCNSPLVVLDDFDGLGGTAWAQEKLFQIVNRRFNSRLPTVFTLTSTPDELPDRLRVRLGDTELATVVTLEEAESPAFQRIGALSLDLIRSMTFESFDAKRMELDGEQRALLKAAFETSKAFAERPEGWIVFSGSYGVGKTHLAAAIANARLGAGEPVFFAIVPDLLDHLRSTFSPESRITYDELFETVRTTPLLVLDDLGAHINSPWAEEKLYQIVNHRYNARLPTVFTTNHETHDLDPRLNSRMVDKQLSTVFPLRLPDFRADTPRIGRSPTTGARGRQTTRGR